MAVARGWLGLLGTLLLCDAAVAQTVSLAEAPQTSDCFGYQIGLRLQGEMRVLQDNKAVALKLSAKADSRFKERVLTLHSDGLPAKAARQYADAQGTVTLDGRPEIKTLRADRRLTVAQRNADGFCCYSPRGPLTREELELAGEHFDTLSLPGLLPAKEVAVGASWKLSNAAAQGLCQFDGLVSHDLTAKLTEVKDGVAVITVTGPAKGIELGAQATLAVTATAKFDLLKKTLVEVEWKQTDDRDQGPASPAVKADVVVTVKRQKLDEEVKELSDLALVGVPAGLEVPTALTQVNYRDPRGRFEINCGRDWQLTGLGEDHTVLRLLERGDFVAQATVTPWAKAPAGQHLDPKAFREAMMSAPGWEGKELVQEGEVPVGAGKWAFRVAAAGEMDGVKVVQNFYLIAAPDGKQVVATFTLKQSQVGKLGGRDQQFVDGVEIK